MVQQALQATIEAMVKPGKGILAADESHGTIGKRFESIGIENTEEHRRQYRSLLATTENLGDHVSGVILFEETLTQKTDDGRMITEAFSAQGVVPGIKVDKGLVSFATSPEEKITQGLDGLAERLATYKEQGARFAKWRDVFQISDIYPSAALVRANAELLARYAAICQAQGIVPIVEPEVLMDTGHDLARCEAVTDFVLHSVFNALYEHKVVLEHIILKPNMVVPGKQCADQSNPKAIAEATVRALKRNVPSAVPTINFLSGGQSPVEATVNLNAINELGPLPWTVSFSYGRALQETCLAAWGGKAENVAAAQAELFKRAKLNGSASMGEYKDSME